PCAAQRALDVFCNFVPSRDDATKRLRLLLPTVIQEALEIEIGVSRPHAVNLILDRSQAFEQVLSSP
ncbi:hypothetical protein, partial [Rhodovulum sulfidophilum]|uniref:hypothetical protein n=1 Tax=Rhodovulum sulfidophilum TaxID=35806 RepID=UPI001F20ACC9